jgi:ABC-type Na+ efflux pump permease subunit
MFSLVYGFSNAATHGWHTPSTWGFLAAGAVLLTVFAAWQARAAQPLLPPRVVLDRNRGGAYLTMLIFGSALFGIFLFLIYYMQLNLGYSAVISGVALLPMVAAVGVMANLGNIVLMPRFGPKPLVIAGLLANAVVQSTVIPATVWVLLPAILLWFVLGYALYSTALGTLGALASRLEDASNASTPVTFVAMGAYFFSLLVVLDNPGGLPARIGSLIPPIAPMVVPLRAALGAVEPWEVVVSALVTLVAIWGLFVLGGRIYSGAVLRTGSRIRLRDAWRAAGE